MRKTKKTKLKVDALESLDPTEVADLLAGEEVDLNDEDHSDTDDEDYLKGFGVDEGDCPSYIDAPTSPKARVVSSSSSATMSAITLSDRVEELEQEVKDLKAAVRYLKEELDHKQGFTKIPKDI